MTQRRGSGARGFGPARARGGRFGSSGAGAGRTGQVRAASSVRAAASTRGPARPGGRRGVGGQGSSGAKRIRAPRPRGFTKRAAVLVAVLLGLLLAYAYPLRVYLGQQAEIAALKAHQVAQSRKIDQLAQERAMWNDKEYIKSKARSRLLWTVDGETPYLVIGGAPELARDISDDMANQPTRPRPWYGKLWSSIAAADQR